MAVWPCCGECARKLETDEYTVNIIGEHDAPYSAMMLGKYATCLGHINVTAEAI